MQLAVFDLDGTITRRDTLTQYVCGYLNRRLWRWPGLLRVLPAVLSFCIGRLDAGAVKGAFIRAALGGCSRRDLDAWTSRFVPQLLATGVFRDALARIAEHRAKGDILVLMSASTDLYVPAIGAALGFAEVVCTGLQWQGELLVGNLATANRRGAEKSRCLEALRQRHPGLYTVAYGNAGSDLDHLRRADQGFLVNGSAASRREADRLAVATLQWR